MTKRKEVNEQKVLFETIELRKEGDEAARQVQKSLKRDMDKKTKKAVVDMLNLIFGHGAETDYFWEYLIEECK